MRSSSSVKAIYLDREKVLEEVKRASEIAKRTQPFVKEVFLFGSLARGEEHGLSDVDILVVVDSLRREEFWEKFGKVHRIFADNLSVDFDLVLVPEEDFKKHPDRFGKLARV